MFYPSDDQLRSHLLGQRHWYNKRQREESQRSVYVKGLPLSPEPNQEEVREVFEQFGNVNMVIIHEKVTLLTKSYLVYNYFFHFSNNLQLFSMLMLIVLFLCYIILIQSS